MTRTEVSGLIVVAISLAMLLTISLPVPISARECTSTDVRNSVDEFGQLTECTVIRGYLMIVLIKRDVSVSDYSNITFPDLREVTDFFILYDVKGLLTLKKLLPNLTVIRGRRLYLNYALIVANMPDLTALDLKSLVAIQRGHVYVGNSPNLCFLHQINWDRLTLTMGENLIVPVEGSEGGTCPRSDCSGCESGYCWSNMVCQKFENDNLVNLVLGSLHCHPECLGGCYNTTNTGCAVCKGITDHGACVTKCPPNLYYSEHHQRCYTQQECGLVRGYVFENQCNRRCPSGYVSSRRRLACIKCEDSSKCVKTCTDSMYNIFDLSSAESVKGCVRLNSSLYIQITNKIDESYLLEAFATLREVQGYVKIVRSPYLKSLNFLKNLKKIEGLRLDNNTYALLIYDNDNLEDLWTSEDIEQLRILDGGINIYSNFKLCNRVVKKFTDSIIHDKDKDHIEYNDEDVLCSPAILPLVITPISPREVNLTWTKNETREQIEVIYRAAKYSKGDRKELDDHVCDRVFWKQEILFLQDLQKNSTHVTYTLGGLTPFTEYEILVKTFEEKSGYAARSTINLFSTLPDRPTAPRLFTLSKTSTSITFAWESRAQRKELVGYYLLDSYEHSVDLNGLDTRDFCERPPFVSRSHFEDYDDCCHRLEEKQLDEEFKRSMELEYPCSSQIEDSCETILNYRLLGTVYKLRTDIDNYTLSDLDPFTTYTFYFHACNEAGCGAFYMYNDKTNYSVDGDKVTKVDACRVPETNEYRLQFKEPLRPNGAIVSYIIHVQNTDSNGKNLGDVKCITRKQHEMAGFKFSITLNETFAQTAVRSTSLAGSDLSEWFNIEICKDADAAGRIGAFPIFLISCIICAVIAISWIAYRRKWWRRYGFRVLRATAESPTEALPLDDRQMLVDTCENVQVQRPNDE